MSATSRLHRMTDAMRRRAAIAAQDRDQLIVPFVSQREQHLGDCTIAAFAMCFALTYSEALVTIAAIEPHVLTRGATWPQLQRAAIVIGARLHESRRFDLDDLEEGNGMLGVRFPNRVEHAVYFKRGLIFDGRSQSVWDADVYLAVNRCVALTMLVRRDA